MIGRVAAIAHWYRQYFGIGGRVVSLATRYHLIALDFSGFEQSEAFRPSAYECNFDHLAETMDKCTVDEAIKVIACS